MANSYKSIDTSRYSSQPQSPLFELPGELRNRIWKYVLADYQDMEKKYYPNSYYSRPDYLAPRRSDTAILRTCRRAYREAWFRPWTGALHTFWLTSTAHRPARHEDKGEDIKLLSETVERMHKLHGEVEAGHVRFFAQVPELETGHTLNPYLKVPHFRPRAITITIRHTDWRWWEQDQDLRIGSQFVRECKLPTSVRVFRMELEDLERRRPQVSSIAQQMMEKWFFERNDGVRLIADRSVQVSKWQGSSMFGSQRWIRDETVPGKLEYHIETVTWRVDPKRSVEASEMLPPTDLRTLVHTPYAIHVGTDVFVTERDLQMAGAPANTPAMEALKMIRDHRASTHSTAVGVRRCAR